MRHFAVVFLVVVTVTGAVANANNVSNDFKYIPKSDIYIENINYNPNKLTHFHMYFNKDGSLFLSKYLGKYSESNLCQTYVWISVHFLGLQKRIF